MFQMLSLKEEKFDPTPILVKYLFNEELSDVKFVVDNEETGEQETIFAHKFILADKCSYFKNLYYGESKDDKEVLTKKTAKVVKPLLEFVYTKKISKEITFATALSLCELAMEMKYDALFIYIFGRSLSERLIDCEVTIENISTVYYISKKFSLESVVQRCNRFVENNATGIISDKLFNELESFLARKVVREAVKTMDNIEIFEAIKNRIESCDDGNSSVLLKLLNLRKINQEQFARFIRPTKLISDNEYFDTYWNEGTSTESTATEAITNAKVKEQNDSKRKSTVHEIDSTHKKMKGNLPECKVYVTPLTPQCIERKTRKNSCNGSEIKEIRRETDSLLYPDKGEYVVFELNEIINGNYLKFDLSDQKFLNFNVHVGSKENELKAIADYTVGIGRQEFIFNEMDVKFVKITSLSSNSKVEILPDSVEVLKSGSTKYQLLRPKKNMVCNSLITREMIGDTRTGMWSANPNNFKYHALRYPCYVNSIAFYFKSKPIYNVDVYVKEDMNSPFKKVYRKKPSQFQPLIVRFELKRVFIIKVHSNDLNKILSKIECPVQERHE